MKSTGSQTTTKETKLPDWVESAARGYLAQGQETAKNLMTPYQGATVAALTDPQLAALRQIQGLSQFSLSPEAIQAQMNPYIANVEQAALAQGQRALERNLSNISDAAIRSGGAFGSRQGVLEGAAVAEQAQNQANLSAQLRQQGYQTAVQNALAGQQAAMQAAQAGLAGGSVFQQQAQAELAAQKAQYDAMRNYPLEQLNILGSTLAQTPYGTTTAESTPTSSNPILGAMGGALSFAKTFGTGGMAPFLGAGLGALAGVSDRSMKTDIEKVGMDKESGLNMYAYRYKGDPKTYPKMVGPMADEIEDKYPEVVKKKGGKKVVAMNFLMGKVKT